MEIEIFIASCDRFQLMRNWLSNPFVKDCNLTIEYDKNREKGLPERYNLFLERVKFLPFIQDHPDWIIFAHDDVKFMEDIKPKLEELPGDRIYGVCGAKKINGKGEIIGQIRIIDEKHILGLSTNNYERVASFDPMVIIIPWIHFDLRFDENLKYHMHAEELCIRTNEWYGYEPYIMQLDCIHYSAGEQNEEYFQAVDYVKRKHGLEKFITTCDKSCLDGEIEESYKKIDR